MIRKCVPVLLACAAYPALSAQPAAAARANVNVTITLPERSYLYCHNAIRRNRGSGRPISELAACEGFIAPAASSPASLAQPGFTDPGAALVMPPPRLRKVDGRLLYEIVSP
ncbi:MAG: hypothetical protein KKB37_12200 [Alphaproteobacteria bacterium]|nr:hypothetical protein [Alphaproteobacteria bacterium]